MRKIEHTIAGARGALRRALSRSGRTDASSVEPARLCIRLDDSDLPGSLGEGEFLQPNTWNKVIVSAVDWLGPIPLTVLATHNADHYLATELVRLAHRLECDTLLVTDGTGIDLAKAEELVDRGLARIRVLIGGMSDEVQQHTVGNSVIEATEAVRNLIAAREDRGAPLDIEVGIPWQGHTHTEVRAIIGWAKQIGVNGFRIMAPWRATDMPADPEVLDAIAAEDQPFNRTPGATIDEIHAMVAHQDGQPGTARRDGPARRRRTKCPVGGQRLAISGTGRMYSCPFKDPIGMLTKEQLDLKGTFAQGKDHLNAISSCDRACAHVELAPRKILSLRG